jgi:hypothetical protein
MITASFGTLKDIHNLECSNLLKYGYGLTLKALCPTNIKRQNVKLVLQVFNKFIIEALYELGGKHNLLDFEGTAEFIKIILHWWNIVNVKTVNKGVRYREEQYEPLRFTDNDKNVEFLEQLIAWLDKWEDTPFPEGKLSKETHWAFKHTTQGLLKMGKYCI